MRILITGAAGFVGHYVVRQALASGHQVRALLLPETQLAIPPGHNVEVVFGDLRNSLDLTEALRDVDSVIHLAAAMRGTATEILTGTVLGTSNLIESMKQARGKRLVLISSMSVYDYLGLDSMAVLDENSPLEPSPHRRDHYCQAKLKQEGIARTMTRAASLELVVIRPGAIVGPGRYWTARLGHQLLSRIWLRCGSDAILPLTYVENCAEAIVRAAELPAAAGETINVVDDDLPNQRQYISMLRRSGRARMAVIPVPWALVRAAAFVASSINNRLLGSKMKLPQLLSTENAYARFQPLRYSNRRVKEVLHWQPKWSIEEALTRGDAKRV
jgi:nucleoside-diphosphate-sugar epimerase